MSKPVYKIETLTGAVLDHTITDEALAIHVKTRITSAPGIFSFAVPTKKGPSYYYNDVAENDNVKIYLGYNSPPVNPNFIGKIQNISGPLSVGTGYIRVFSGMCQGEVTVRRQKTKYWSAIGASTIVTELATDLGILGAGDITADATAVTLACTNEPYWSVLQRISDYWFNAGAQVKKDFFVDVDGHLHWKARPIRAAGVETLTVGENIVSYNVIRDVKSVANKIHVYGADTKTYQSNTDGLSDGIADWTADGGDAVAASTTRKFGGFSVRIFDAGPGAGALRDNIGTQKATYPNRECYRYLNFWFQINDDAGVPVPYAEVSVRAPNLANSFKWQIAWNTNPRCGPLATWIPANLPLGENQVTAGQWIKFGNAAWDNIQGLHFFVYDVNANNIDIYVDQLHLSGARFYDCADAAETPVKEYTMIDDKLLSDSDCQKRGETLLYQMKNTPIRIDATVPLNTNILIGDRLPMTIPAENISAVDFDVVEVDHYPITQGFTTTAKMVNTADKRVLPSVSQNEVLMEKFKLQKQLNLGMMITK